ncbi:GNAT family N-acetyltransferase [Nocardioides dokdonensis]|uniref:GNAT family N-acetyltransferase n=1 Tax=Nocardioides dokdonensis TaxID=450734 RepID=UPI0014714D11|nr:GNAT family N-acetyltransferase [Nocardioides dokdonensis]
MSTTVDRPAVPAGAGRLPALVDAAALVDAPGGERAWRDLVRSARHANPFLDPDVLLPALRHLPPPGGARLLTGGTEDRLELLLPVTTGHRVPRNPVRATVAWQHTHHFLGTPLVAPGLHQRGWRSALRDLAAGGDAWFVLPLTDLDVVQDVEAAARGLGLTSRRLEERVRPVTHRHEHDDYAAQRLSGRRRKELRRVRRRLDEAVGGGLDLVDLVDGATAPAVEAALEQFLGLEAAGWKGTDGGAFAANPAERAFFLESCRALAADGRLEVLALQGHEGGPVAMVVNLRSGDALFTFKIAYDEQHAAYSPGLLLYLEQLSRFHTSGAALVDTCAEPDHPMARRLHGDDRCLVTLAVSLGPHRGALAVRWAHTVTRLAGAVRRHRAPTRQREDHP